MEIHPDEIVKSKNNPLELFYSSMRAEATRADYDRKLCKVLCEFFRPILKGDPDLVKRAESEPKIKKKGVKRQFSDADFEQSNSTLRNTQDFVSESKFLTNWLSIEHQGWKLPSTVEAHDWCGLWKTIGCNKVDVHEKLGKGKLTYVKQFRRSCYRAKCKSCYTNWIARQANVSTRRIEAFEKKSKQRPVHLILSVPRIQRNLPVKLLRQRMSVILKYGKIHGASVIFHPFKFNKIERRWYSSPHFHLVGFGKSSDLKNAFGRYGWYVKEAGERESVFQTFCYLLSHCGIQKGYQAVTWFGSLSYSKLHVEKEPRITKCPLCNGEFEEIYYEEPIHPIIPPDKHYEGLVNEWGWHKVLTVEYEEPTYEYAPTRDLNELLRGLTMIIN